jgi:hypothetical protein
MFGYQEPPPPPPKPPPLKPPPPPLKPLPPLDDDAAADKVATLPVAKPPTEWANATAVNGVVPAYQEGGASARGPNTSAQ